MDEIKIRSDNHISVGANIKRIRESKGVRAFDLIRELQLQGLNINKQRYYCARSTFLAKILNIFGKIFWENRSLK